MQLNVLYYLFFLPFGASSYFIAEHELEIAFLSISLTLPLYCSVLQGSVSEYCFHNCKAAPVIIVPGKGQFKFFRLCLDPGKVEEKVTSNTVAQCRIFRLFVVNIVLP